MPFNNTLPIGLFDSGIGGLTVLKELVKLLPQENFIYFADNLHLPLGDKTETEILSYAKETALFLLRKKIKLLVVACNTTSSIALDALRDLLPIPVIGVIQPLVKEAILLKKARIGVIATRATIRTGVYAKELTKKAPQSVVFEKACPLLVPLIEKGDFFSGELKKTVEIYLKPLKQAKIELLLLGCTHYPLVRAFCENYLGPDTEIIEASLPCALEVKKQLLTKGLANTNATTDAIIKNITKKSSVCFFVSGDELSFQRSGELFLGKTIEKVLRKDNNFTCIQKSKDEVLHGL